MNERERERLFYLAAPACGACGAIVIRVEFAYRLTCGGEWWPSGALVCANGCRIPVEPV